MKENPPHPGVCWYPCRCDSSAGAGGGGGRVWPGGARDEDVSWERGGAAPRLWRSAVPPGKR